MISSPQKTLQKPAGLPKNRTELLWDIREGWSFGVRIPLPPLIFSSFWGGGTNRQFASSLWMAPVMGFLLCSFSVGLGLIGWYLTGSFFLGSLIILSSMLLLSGNLHEDGLADIADAFGVLGRDVASYRKRLAVMKDPNLGTFGVQALLLSFTFRFFGMVSVCTVIGFEGMAVGFVSMGASTRVLMVWLLYLLPRVRKEGFADKAGVPSGGVVTCATILGFVPLVVGFGSLAGWAILVLMICFGVWFLLMKRMFGGITGDGCGAMVVVGEVSLWLWFSVLVQYAEPSSIFYLKAMQWMIEH